MAVNKYYKDGVLNIVYDKDTLLVTGTAEAENIHTGVESVYNATVKAGAGNDSVVIAAGGLAYGEAGDDWIGSSGASVRAYGGDGNDYIHLTSDYDSVDGGTGHDDIFVWSHGLVYGGEGNDTISVWKYSCVYGGAGDDVIKGIPDFNNNGEGYITLYGGIGKDTLTCGDATHCSIDGGVGDDYLYVSGCDHVILGGDGNDRIKYEVTKHDEGGKYATIQGGTGNDTISLSGHGNNESVVIKYSAGDGSDVIYGVNSAADVLQINSGYTLSYAQTAEQKKNGVADLIVKMSGGSIKMKNLNVSEYRKNPLKIIGGSGGGGSTAYTYTGGNKSIENYAGQKVIWSTNFKGIGLNSTDFKLKSGSGTLTLKNARNKVINVSNASGKTLAYAYMASGGANINASKYSQRVVIIGGNNASNVLSAGSGGSTLWGGSGSTTADTLRGGAGVDYFFMGKSDGSDVISNASKDDRVMLYNAARSDIAGFSSSSNSLVLRFKSGSTLEVNDSGGISPIFQLANGSKWRFNHTSKSWQSG